MQTVKFQIFSNPEFVASFNKLIDVDLPVRASSKLSKIHEVLAVNNQQYVDKRNDIIKEHAQTDDEGLPVMDDDGNILIIADHGELINADFKVLFETEFEIEQITLDELGDVSLPARVITSLRSIFAD